MAAAVGGRRAGISDLRSEGNLLLDTERREVAPVKIAQKERESGLGLVHAWPMTNRGAPSSIPYMIGTRDKDATLQTLANSRG